jgi:hypothetical protein
MAVPARLVLGGTSEGIFDGLAEHEMMAKETHCLPGGAAHRGQAHALDQATHHTFGRFTGLDHPRRHSQRPGGCGHEPGIAMGLVVAPAALLELVFDQPVLGQGVGHPEQCFGQDHQRQPFTRRKSVFAQEIVDTAHLAGLRTDRIDQL